MQTLTICIALVERRSLWQTAFDNELAKSPPQKEDTDLELRAVSMLAPHAAQLLKRLSEDNDQPLLVSLSSFATSPLFPGGVPPRPFFPG